MPKLAQLPPKKLTTLVGSVDDLRSFLKNLCADLQGLEEIYEVNLYHDQQTGEKWIEITPTR
jgi:hypothetical protein